MLLVQSKINRISQESPTVCRVEIKVSEKDSPNLVFNPGQFYFLGRVGIGEAAFSSVRSDVDDRTIVFLIRVVGTVTEWIAGLKKGDEIEMRGPLGNGFPIDEIRGKDVILASGGCGIAPIAAVAEYITRHQSDFGKIFFLYGAKNPEELLLKEEVARWPKQIKRLLTIDQECAGWRGNIGFVPALLDKIKIDPKNTSAVICGPPLMFTAMKEKLVKKGVELGQIFVSLERKMVCGIGKCQHCTCGEAYVCIDGPVFRLSEINVNAA